MVEKQPRTLAHRQGLAVDADTVFARDVEGGRRDHRAIDADAPGGNPVLGVAPRTQPRARDYLGDALCVLLGRSGSRWFGARQCALERLARLPRTAFAFTISGIVVVVLAGHLVVS